MLHSELNEKYLKGSEIVRWLIEGSLTLSDNGLQLGVSKDLVRNSDDCVWNAKKSYSKLKSPLA
ncbi:hypothetical protein AD933_02400 [Acetobacter malorum]|uniref:Uncharacterized protein n=1 Tax=Acetobacter malorum TaxID=178901 RepID=A0A149RXL2_9PROT|nr:hypothetical protein AD933_02400 [Acetobacter malorum]